MRDYKITKINCNNLLKKLFLFEEAEEAFYFN